MALKAFTFDGPLMELFVGLGYDLYRDDPAWVPPLRAEVWRQLSASFPFYARPRNDHRRFLALSDGRPLARCLASVNRDLVDGDGEPIGAIGFFEAADDYPASEDVLAGAVRWLREEHGLRRIWGPMNFDIWHGYRFMTRGFERDRFLGEPCNRPSYPETFERFGFVALKQWNTFELDGALQRLEDDDGWRRRAERGYRLEPFDLGRFDSSVEALHWVLTRSFSSFVGYTPISLPDFRGLMSVARHAVRPECSVFVYDEKGALAGFTTVFSDLAQAVRAMAGSSSPLAKLRFLRACRRRRRLMIHLGGITPEESAKHNGIAAAAFGQVAIRVRAQRAESVLATLVARGNPVRRLYGEYALDRRREYTLYELAS